MGEGSEGKALRRGGFAVSISEDAMEWTHEAMYCKAKLYAQRANNEPIDSALFGFWTSLALELLCRAALARIHPVLLADPTNEDNIQYAFGIIPKRPPKSVHAKTVFARCSVFIPEFTDKMSGHCLILADRRNTELHSGAASFEGLDNSAWLPATYEVMDVVLGHIGTDFHDFLGPEHAPSAVAMLKDRRDTIKREVKEKISESRKVFAALDPEWITQRATTVRSMADAWVQANQLRRTSTCPACGSIGLMTGENMGRTPVRIDEATGTITREVRALPNVFVCPHCKLSLKGFQELHEAGMGAIYTVSEEEDPIAFFGIVPEEHVDVDELIRNYYESDYQNE
jgi:hypothetical protein